MTHDLTRRIAAIKQLLGLFRLERMVYICVTVMSLGILFWCAISMMNKEGGEATVVVAIFGGSGGILYTTGRLLKMWSDALRMLGSSLGEDEDAGS